MSFRCCVIYIAHAAYCYGRNAIVCLCVWLITTVSHVKWLNQSRCCLGTDSWAQGTMLFDALRQLSGTHYRKLFSVVTLLQFFKSRLKTFLFSQAFSFSLYSLTRGLAPSPLKLRPYGAIQICLLLISLLPRYTLVGGEAAMLTYTAAQLKVLDFDDPPLRPVRRTLFTFHLWRRAGTSWRRHVGSVLPRLAVVSQPSWRSADHGMVIRWLNVQSLCTTTDIVHTLRTHQSQYVKRINNNNNNDRLTAFDPGQPG